MHIIRCSAATELRSQQTNLTRTKLMKLQTYPSLTILIMNVINMAIDPRRRDSHYVVPTSLQRCYQRQLQIGAFAFLKGCITQELAHKQHEFALCQNRAQTGNQWAAQVLQILWNFVFIMWEDSDNTLHRSEDVQNIVHNIKSINQEIRRQWRIDKTGLGTHHHRLFCLPLPQLLSKNRQYKQE